MIDGTSTPPEAMGVTPAVNELTVTPKNAPEKIGVQEITPSEATRYSNSIPCLPNATIDLNSDPPITYLALRSDENRRTVEDVYEENPLGKKTEPPVIARWISSYTKIHGPIKVGVSPGRNMVVEPMIIDLSSSQIEYLPNGAKIIIVRRPDTQFSHQIDVVKNAIALGENISSQFGIASNSSDLLLIFTPQASIADSAQDTTERTIIVGTHNIADWNNSDINAVATHEKTHADFQTSLLPLGIDYDKLYFSHFLYPTLRFFNEGIATLAHETVRGKQPRNILKERYQEIPERIRGSIENGEYAYASTYDEARRVNHILEQAGKNDAQKQSVNQLLSRYLPAAVTAFCISKGIKIQDIAKVQLDQFEPAKKTIAEKYSISADEVALEPVDTLDIIKRDKPDLFPDIESWQKIIGEIEEICRSSITKPFEAIGQILKQNPAIVAQEFSAWLQK